MDRTELTELHFISHIHNLQSILQRGIVSNRLSAQIEHTSLAKDEVQDLRSAVRVPGGRQLHEYANLYICGRNPTLYRMIKNVGNPADVLVLRVAPIVLDLPGVVLTDQNAASDYRAFLPSPAGLAKISKDVVFAEYWTHQDDQIETWKHKSAKCAEVLVPDVVPPCFLTGVYVFDADTERRIQQIPGVPPIIVDKHLFFR